MLPTKFQFIWLRGESLLSKSVYVPTTYMELLNIALAYVPVLMMSTGPLAQDQ
jgi:hypothetical protein